MGLFKKTANALVISAVVFIAFWMFLSLEVSSRIDISFISYLGFAAIFIRVVLELS